MIIATTKQRLLYLLDLKHISKSEFYKKTVIKRGLLDSDKLESSIPDTTLAKIIATFPEINLTWLITGNGEMFATAEASTRELVNYLREKDEKIELLIRKCARLEQEVEQLKYAQQQTTPNYIQDIARNIENIEKKIDKKGEDVDYGSHVATRADAE